MWRVCIWVCVFTEVYVGRSADDFVELLLSFHLYKGSSDWNLVTRLVWQAPLLAEPFCWPHWWVALTVRGSSCNLNASIKGRACSEIREASFSGPCRGKFEWDHLSAAWKQLSAWELRLRWGCDLIELGREWQMPAWGHWNHGLEVPERCSALEGCLQSSCG